MKKIDYHNEPLDPDFEVFARASKIYQDSDPRNPDFFSILNKGHDLFFDIELVGCWKLVKRLYDIFKNVHNRFERKEIYNVSTSMSKKLTYDIQSVRYPWIYYDFRDNDVRVSILKYGFYFYIFCDGSPFTTSNWSHYCSSFRLSRVSWDSRFYAPLSSDNAVLYYDSVECARQGFYLVLNYLIELEVNHELF